MEAIKDKSFIIKWLGNNKIQLQENLEGYQVAYNKLTGHKQEPGYYTQETITTRLKPYIPYYPSRDY